MKKRKIQKGVFAQQLAETKNIPSRVFEATINFPGLKARIGRNEKCPCKSGKKYKYCHGRDV